MKRYARIFKNTFPLMTLLALLALALGYYLFYVRGKEAYFTHRYLRLLAFASGQIEERLDTIESVFANYQKDDTLTAADLDGLAKDLRALPSIERVDAPPDFHVACDGVTLEGRIEGDQFWVYAGWRELPKKGEKPGKRKEKRCGEAKDAQTAVFRFDPFALTQYGQRKSFEGFETFLVASRDGTVLFRKNQRGSREVHIVSLKGLATPEGKAVDLVASARATSNLEVTLGGEPYRLFLRPCCRKIWAADREPPAGEGEKPKAQHAALKEAAAAGNSLELVVGGAVRTSTLSAQTWSISFTVGLAVVSLLALALLSLAFLRVLAIGPKEKLRVADALWVGFSAVVGVGLLTLLLVDLHAYQSLMAGTDDNLETLAREIKGNMKKELTAAWAQLGEFNRSALTELAKGDPRTLAKVATCGDVTDRKLPARRKVPPPAYFEFERFAWVDSRARQCFKWSLDDAKDPLVQDIRERRYFREARSGRAAIEPVNSWATGRWVVALSRPVKPAPPFKLAQPFVGVLGVEMNSLNRPVLPPGYGFAVIDESGAVLFHSEQGRAGYENFFDETDNDRGLNALVFARRSGSQDAAYLGEGHRLFVTPIQPPAPSREEPIRTPPFWTLIVFSDKAEMRSFNIDTMSTATLLLVLYLFIYMVGFGLLRSVRRRYRAGWLWPEKKGEMREKNHLALTVFYALCLAAFVAAFQQLDGIGLLWFAFAFPWAVLLVSYRLCTADLSKRRQAAAGAALAGVLLLIHLAPGDGGAFDPAGLLKGGNGFLAGVSLGLWACFLWGPRAQRLQICPPRRVYLAAASLLLMVTAAGPAVAFFCIAHRAHLETRIKRAQLELALDREARDRRLDWRYNQLKDKGAAQDSLFKKVEARRNTFWDLYHCFYFGTRFQEPCPASPSSPRPVTAVATAGMTPAAGSGGKDAGQGLCTLLPGFIQKVLPLYTEDFIRVRWLMADSDRGERHAWSWSHAAGGGMTFQLNGLSLASVIPRVSLAGLPLLWPLSLLLLAGTVTAVARFIAQRCFLFGLPTPEAGEPMSLASASTQNFILVSPHIDDMAQRLAGQKAAVIDLRELATREDLLQCLGRADLVASPRICVHHFEHRLQDETHNLLKLELMEELILGRDKPVIVLCHMVPAWYLLDRQPAGASEGGARDPEKAGKEIQERWRQLLRRFLTWVCRNRADVNRLNSDLGAIQEHALAQGTRNGRRLTRLLDAAREECGESEQLECLAGDLVRARLQDLSPDLFYDELRERAEPYYRALWTMCTEAEKVVLVHLAEGGLVNGKNADALKMLMRRGLVKRDPCFRLMNESFRRFVATDVCLDEVRSLERQAGASTWDRIRAPFIVSLIGVCAFFFVTQREVFDVSMAFFSAVAASLPALFRVLGAAAPGQGKAAS